MRTFDTGPDYREFLRRAYLTAAKYSSDRKTQNGAVLLARDGRCVDGYNHFVWELDEYPSDAEKGRHMMHAEEHAIVAAARAGVPTQGATLVCPWAACMPCARMIVGAGIRYLVTHAPMMGRTYPKYVDEIKLAHQHMQAAGVVITSFTEDVGQCTNLMLHEKWNP
jgi:deoxycytidylate deaminase